MKTYIDKGNEMQVCAWLEQNEGVLPQFERRRDHLVSRRRSVLSKTRPGGDS